ncbi:MAG: hypothetical protein A2W19_13895 [Spirochaetes bacterium RBG_16_49_21]|nr:MAG: hypothetical protein A2W19_13895 [Spirochaetes bacterium RBG_16_49_21]
MNINKYPEIQPGKKLIKRIYVAVFMWFFARAIQAAAKVDEEVKKEVETIPANFTLRLIVNPEKAFPLFFYAKMLPRFIVDKGILLYGLQMIMGKDKKGKFRYQGSDPRGKKINLSMAFTSLEAAMMVFTFRESLCTGYAHSRFVVEGDLPFAQSIMRIMDLTAVFLLPKIVAKLVVKRYPKWSEMSPLRKYLNRVLVYLRMFTV